MFHLQKRLIEAVVVVGADECSGLLPWRPLKLTSAEMMQLNDALNVDYRPQILATLTETTAIYVHRMPSAVDPFYPPPEFTEASLQKSVNLAGSVDGDSFGSGPSSEVPNSPTHFKGVWRQSAIIKKGGGNAANLRLSRTMDKRQGSVINRSSSRAHGGGNQQQPHAPRRVAPSSDNLISADALEGLPYLLYPEGIQIQKRRCTPQIDYLVLTSINGDRRHAVVLTFTRAFRLRNRTKDGKVNLLLEDDEETFLEEVTDHETSSTTSSQGLVYIPQSVILVSQLAYFSLMKEMLSLLYKVIEVNDEHFGRLISRFAASLTNTPTMWGESGAMLELTLFDHRLRIPPPIPLMKRIVDFDLTLLTKTLTPDDLISVVCALVTQRRVVVVSNNPVLSTLCCEGLMLLIRPFEWRFTYVPWLPASQLEFLEAPGPFLFGFHIDFMPKILQYGDVLCVDLDKGVIHPPQNVSCRIPEPPKAAVRRLKESLRALNRDYEVFSLCNLEPMTMETVRENREDYRRRNQKHILFAFLRFSVDCFRGVLPYIQHRRTSFNSQTAANIFKRELFLKSLTEAREFYQEVVNSEIFSTFLRHRFKDKLDAWAQMEEHTRNESNIGGTPGTKRILSTMLTRARSGPQFGTLSVSYSESTSTLDNDEGTSMVTNSALARYLHREAFRFVPLPPYYTEQSTNFFDRFSEELLLRIQQEEDLNVKTGLLLLRADCQLSLGRYEQVFDDLHVVLKLGLFTLRPPQFRSLLACLDEASLTRLENNSVKFREVKRLSGISHDGVDSARSKLPDWEMQHERVMKQVPLPQTPVCAMDFMQFCQVAQITYCKDVQERLFKSLTLDQQRLEELLRAVDPLMLRHFYSVWNENIQCPEDEICVDIFHDSEVIFKVSPEIRVDNLGSGRLFMTESRLLFFSSGTRMMRHLFYYKNLVQLEESTSTTFGLKAGVGTLKIRVNISPEDEDQLESVFLASDGDHYSSRSGTYRQKSSSSTTSSNKRKYVAWLKQDTHLWFVLLMEFWSANMCAIHQRDSGLLTEAIDNCLIIDTFHSLAATSAAEGEKFFLCQSPNLQMAEQVMASFTAKVRQGLHELPPLTEQLLSMKCDLDPCDIFPKCIEALVAIPRGDEVTHQILVALEIWCMYNGSRGGKLVVLDAGEMQIERVVLSLNVQLRSLAWNAADRHLWVGGGDHRIYVVDVEQKRLQRILVEHTDMVLHLAVPPYRMASDPLHRVLSATQKCDVILWDAKGLTVDTRWKLRGLKENSFLNAITFCGPDHVLCAIRTGVFLYSCRGGDILAGFSPTNLPHPIQGCSLEHICVVSEADAFDEDFGTNPTFSIYLAHGKNGLIHHLRVKLPPPSDSNETVEMTEMTMRKISFLCNEKEVRRRAVGCTVCHGDSANLCPQCANVISCYGISRLLYARNYLWAACKDGQIFIFNLNLSEPTGEPHQVSPSFSATNEVLLLAHKGAVQNMCYVEERDLLLTGGRYDSRIALWDLSRMRQMQ